jgi:hypothetical protein
LKIEAFQYRDEASAFIRPYAGFMRGKSDSTIDLSTIDMRQSKERGEQSRNCAFPGTCSTINSDEH